MEPKLYWSNEGFILSLHQPGGIWLLSGSTFKVRLFSEKPPFLSHADSSSTNLFIGKIPISIANSEIKKELKGFGVWLRSPFKDEMYTDAEGRLTRFKTGRRFCYVDLPNVALPESMKIGHNFQDFLCYREQGAGKSEGERGKTASTQPGSGQASDQCPSPGDLIDHPDSEPDADSKNTHDRSENIKINNGASAKVQSAIATKSAIERARARQLVKDQ